MTLIGPRFGILLWWLLDQDRWRATFSSFWIAAIGFFFAPWTTIFYMVTFPGGIEGFDWIILGIGVVLDFGSYSGGVFSRRR